MRRARPRTPSLARSTCARCVCSTTRARAARVRAARACRAAPGLFPGAGSVASAARAGTRDHAEVDPTSGLVASLGFASVVCVVGVAREPCLGEDAAGAGATRAGRRAAVTSGVPTVVAAVPTTSASQRRWRACRGRAGAFVASDAKQQNAGLEAPRNSPRAHFPFPTNGRWASLGTRAFPWPDAEMAAAAEGAATRRAGDFANEDCWSLGGGASAFGGVVGDPRRGGAGRERRSTTTTNEVFRTTLVRCAPRCARRSGTGTCSCA